MTSAGATLEEILYGRKPTSWTLVEAVELCQSLVKPLKEVGAWPALGGGVLNRGWSNKDVDILVMPLKRGVSFAGVQSTLLQLGWQFNRVGHDYFTPGRIVDVCELPDGRRVDVFYLDWI